MTHEGSLEGWEQSINGDKTARVSGGAEHLEMAPSGFISFIGDGDMGVEEGRVGTQEEVTA